MTNRKPTYEELENRIKELEFESKKRKNSIDEKTNLETTQKLQFLRDSALELITLKSEGEIYHYMGKSLNSLIENSIVLINETNVEDKTQVLKQIHGIDNTLLGKAIKIMGYNPTEKTFELNDNFEVLYTKGKINHFQGGVAELSEGTLSSLSSKAIEMLFDISNVYSIGIVKETQIFGSLHIFTRKGSAINDYHLIESFINQVSIVLQKLQISNELVKAKVDAEDSKNQINSFLENTEAGYFFIDKDGFFQKVNKAWLNLYKYDTFEEVIGVHFAKVQRIEDVESANEYVEGIMNGNSEFMSGEFGRLCNDGTIGYHSFSAKPVIVNDTVVGIEGFIIDTTKQKKVQDELKQSEEKFSTIFQNSPNAMSLSSLENGEAFEINNSFTELFGYTRDDVIGKTSTVLNTWVDDEIRDRLAHQIKSKGFLNNVHVQFHTKSNIVVDVITSASIIKSGGAMMLVTEFHDITNKMKAENLLQESENRFRKMIENMPSGVAIYLPVNNASDFKFIDLNREAELITKANKKDLIGHTLLEKFPNMEGSPLIDSLRTISKEGNNIHVPPFYYKDDKREGWRENYIYKLQTGEIVAIFKDVTQLKEAEDKLLMQNEQLLLAKEKAEESDRLKSAFLANMSHEIRTPMNAILGFSNLLKREDLASDKKEKYLKQIESGGNRLLHLISDIVDVSKIDANQLSINYEACNVNNLIDNLQDQFNIHDDNNVIDIIIKKGVVDNRSNILTDETRLTQILSNLIENSLKFTKNGSIEFGYGKKGRMLEFFVKDTGIGIDKKHHAEIFHRFTQVDNDYSRDGAGTGLGLSIVKSLTELLGGKVWVESEINKGAVFYFSIPYITTESKIDETNEIDVDLKLDKEVTVLIAEDEYSNYLYLEALFENYKYNLIHAKNGREAVEMFLNNDSIDLILMDVRMPIMNGLEATKEIRKTNKLIPIISLTAYAMAENKEKALKAGCNDYLAKPLSENILSEVLRKYI